MAETTTAANEKLEKVLAKHAGEDTAVVGLLQDIHAAFGYLPEEVLRQVSARKGIPVSLLYSLATFYASFRLEPMGKHHVCVCVGTACHVRGSAKIVDTLERELGVSSGGTTPDGQFTLDTVNCVGACAMGPLVLVDDEYHGQMDQKKGSKLIRQVAGTPASEE